MDVLDAMIRYGVSLSRSVELAAQWDKIWAVGPLYPVTLDDLSAVRGLGIGDFYRVVSPLSVLPIVYRIWASACMGQLDGWFKSWVPDSVFSAGGGRGSVEAWFFSALDIEEVLTGAAERTLRSSIHKVVWSRRHPLASVWCRAQPAGRAHWL